MWTKFTNFEMAARAPLIMRIPGVNEGLTSDFIVEFVGKRANFALP